MNTMNRRDFLAPASATPVIRARSAGSAKPPNLMIMVGDDHSYLDIGCVGNKQVSTPNLYRLFGTVSATQTGEGERRVFAGLKLLF